MTIPGPLRVDRREVVDVEIAALSTACSPRLSGVDTDHVEVLAAVRAALPPITVHHPTMRVIDGLHRVRAAELRGRATIPARFFHGAEADAFVLAVEANIAHGLPLTTADRKGAARRIITSHPHWSDRMIASVAGIAPGTVAEIRRRAPGGARGTSRLGQDGRVRPVNGAEGRRLAGEIIAANPGLSLRQVARAARISPETVRDVRNRMLRGEDPQLRRGRRPAGPGGAPVRRGGSGPVAVPDHAPPRNLAPARALDRAPARNQVQDRNQIQDRNQVQDRNPAPGRAPAQDRAAAVERLMADPALRFSETGRTLLRLLTLHTLAPADWDRIIDQVPPHCGGIVARLAVDCAEMWADVAERVQRKVAETA
ncbi:ParB/RepB/Spo0J family partition protein [Streptomyces longispororuber]|uniref:ParB/RepB/Spo0J family partition protein n=1 Tax=Streptomyces longispororuber TaxID=68230 RepID=UPI0036F907D5